MGKEWPLYVIIALCSMLYFCGGPTHRGDDPPYLEGNRW